MLLHHILMESYVQPGFTKFGPLMHGFEDLTLQGRKNLVQFSFIHTVAQVSHKEGVARCIVFYPSIHVWFGSCSMPAQHYMQTWNPIYYSSFWTPSKSNSSPALCALEHDQFPLAEGKADHDSLLINFILIWFVFSGPGWLADLPVSSRATQHRWALLILLIPPDTWRVISTVENTSFRDKISCDNIRVTMNIVAAVIISKV